MYVDPNYRTKKAFLAAVKEGVVHHPYINGRMFQPPLNGRGVVEGPHYPKPHTWYSQVMLKDGAVISAE